MYNFLLITNALFNSLDPGSLSQACAYYELYPESPEGKKSLERIRALLKIPQEISVEKLIPAIHRFPQTHLKEEEIAIIEQLASHLPNRKLKGYHIENEEQLVKLDQSEIDLSKALLIFQTGGEQEIKNYLALMDLMALQVLARLPKDPTVQDKVKEMNRFVFQELRFRFPPHSIYAKKIDHFTFLPSVMDNHIGVCLGVSTLYLCLAQRIALPLEIITPPGHIFVRCPHEDGHINIETTARGIDLPDEHYQTIHVKKKLAPRTIKEVIGMTFINKASICWEEGLYEKAIPSYETALKYLNDPFTQELLAFSYIISGQKEKGNALLKNIAMEHRSDVTEDYLAGKVNVEGLKTMFMHVDETRESILAKQEKMQKVLDECPFFRSGHEQLAVGYLQLHRPKEAIGSLLRYHHIDESNPLIEYYLAVLHAERKDYEKAWAFLKNAKKHIKDHFPKVLRELKEELICQLSEPDERVYNTSEK